MAVRKKRSSRSPSTPEPFNNPFGQKIRKLKHAMKSVREQLPRARSMAEQGARTDRRTDAEIFLDAVASVPRLEPGSTRPSKIPAPKPIAAVAPRERAALDPSSDEHFDLRFSDQFIRGRSTGVSRETMRKLESGEFAVRSHVDLHGMPLDDARVVVDQFLVDRQRHGERCVLLITGKGRNSPRQLGVLREGIPQWLARGPSARRVLAFVTARPCDGGEGALYVLLRKYASRKNRIDVESGGGT